MKVSASVFIVAILGSATAHAASIEGIWSGHCDRAGHQPVHGEITSQGGNVTFFGKPVTALDFKFPKMAFDTNAGASGTVRHFDGAFRNGISEIHGTLTQSAGEQSADCTFDAQ
jgi:hypothetical protein